MSFARRGKFSAIISSNRFSIPFSLLLWGLSNVNVSMLVVVPGNLNPHRFLFIFSFCCSHGVISTNLFSRLLLRSSASTHLLLISSTVLSISVIEFFSPDWVFFYTVCLCKFSLSPSLPLLTVVTILMTIILNTLSGKLLSSHLVLFLMFLSLALVYKNSFLFSFCLCVCLYALGRSATAPVLERVGVCSRCPVGQFLLVTRARCSGVSPVCAVCILLLCLDHSCALVGAVWLY